jgi:hypothetical protein
MTTLQESDDSGSHVMLLLEQRKYEEALPILSDLMEKNPSHREYFMYHLLVLRILVLHWDLSRATSGPVNYLCEIRERIVSKLALIPHVSERLRIIRSLGQIYEAGHRSWKDLNIKCGGRIGGAGCAMIITVLSFYMNGVSKVENLVPANMLTVTDAMQLAVSESNAYHPNVTEIANQDRGQTQLPTEAYNFLRGTSERKELLLREISTSRVAVIDHLHEFTEQESRISGRHVTNKPPQVNASSVFAKRQEPAAVENKGDKKPQPILKQYQVRRAIPIRKSPRFAAATVQEVESGILLNVLEFIGSWAKVELASTGATGFVRREFLIAINNTDSNVTHNRRGTDPDKAERDG